MLRITADVDEKAWISLNSKKDAFSGDKLGETFFHDLPAFVMRRTVAFAPEAHTVFEDTGERPRNCAVEFVGVRVHVSFG